MLSKNKIKLTNSLSQKKFRDETGLFIAEGTKLVQDLASVFTCAILVATPKWLNQNSTLHATECIEVDETELHKISQQKTQQGVIAIFEKPHHTWTIESINKRLCLALDNVQDPGNLGTIIRLADWFGISDIFCSEYSADAFSPKTVQASMGALARVRVHTVNLSDFLEDMSSEIPIYGTFMDGENIYTKTLTSHGIIVMGNEGNGISPEIEKWVTQRLLIPSFPLGQATSESLNVGIASALVCGEFRRRTQDSL